MNGLDPIPVAQAGPIMAKALGLSWCEDRAEVVEHLNKYRLLLYTSYDKFKLFNDAAHLITVAQFDGYQGVTLPPDIAAVEGVWSCDVPLAIRSRWREMHTGIGLLPGTRMSTIELAEMFPTERDLTVVGGTLKVYAEHSADTGKDVFVTVKRSDTERVERIRFPLEAATWQVSDVPVKKVLEVSLPTLTGYVQLAQDDGTVLSAYAPWETAPMYRRLKLSTSSCACPTVLLQGTKRFVNIYFDHDIVEVGNQLIMEAAARYFRFGEASTDSKEIQRSEFDLAKMEKLLVGLIARHRGRAIQDGNPFRGRQITKTTTLPGYARRRNSLL